MILLISKSSDSDSIIRLALVLLFVSFQNTAQSVFAMLTKNGLKKVGGARRMNFVLYFHPRYG